MQSQVLCSHPNLITQRSPMLQRLHKSSFLHNGITHVDGWWWIIIRCQSNWPHSKMWGQWHPVLHGGWMWGIYWFTYIHVQYIYMSLCYHIMRSRLKVYSCCYSRDVPKVWSSVPKLDSVDVGSKQGSIFPWAAVISSQILGQLLMKEIRKNYLFHTTLQQNIMEELVTCNVVLKILAPEY